MARTRRVLRNRRFRRNYPTRVAVSGTKPTSIGTPGTNDMTEYATALVGTRYSFPVTGNKDAQPVFGSNPFAVNSNLSAAAVHAGVLAHGATGNIAVEMIGASTYSGTARNGVVSLSLPSAAGYRILAGNAAATTAKGAFVSVEAYLLTTTANAARFPIVQTPWSSALPVGVKSTLIAKLLTPAAAAQHTETNFPTYARTVSAIYGVSLLVKNGQDITTPFQPTLAYRPLRLTGITGTFPNTNGPWTPIVTDRVPFTTYAAKHGGTDFYYPKFTLTTFPAPGRKVLVSRTITGYYNLIETLGGRDDVEWIRAAATWPHDDLTYKLGALERIGDPVDIGDKEQLQARQYRLTLPAQLGGYNIYWGAT